MDFKEIKKMLSNRETPMHIPTVYNFEPCCAQIGGGFESVTEYYLDIDLKLNRQISLIEKFSDSLVFPGIFPDLGVVVEVSAFGGQLEWSEKGAPYCHPSLRNIEEVDHLKMPLPGQAGLTALLLAQKKIMQKKAKEKGKELRKFSMSMGPAEIAGLLLGYDKLFVAFYDEPERVKKLIDMICDFVIEWIKVQGEITGGNEVILIADHMCSQVNSEIFEEFIFPYLKRVFNAFPDVIKVYHNEGKHSDRHIELVLDFGADIWHFGSDVHEIKDLLKKVEHKIVLFGGLNPHGVIRTGTTSQVQEEASYVKEMAKCHSLLFSTGTGTTPDTTYENMRALINVAK